MNRVISFAALRKFWSVYPETEASLKSWYEYIKEAEWETPVDVKKSFRNASILKKCRVVFNIKGNNYRLVVKINYEYQIMWIRFIGTHADYDKI